MDDAHDAAGGGRPVPPMERRAFLSFSHKDHRFGARLLARLKHYRVPAALREAHGRRLRVTSRDRAEVMAGGELSERLKHELTASDALIVVCSPRAAASRWVNQEIAAFKLMGKGARIIPVIVHGDEAEALPLTLRFDVDADGGPTDHADATQRTVVDLRRGGDGWRRGRVKIIAAVLGADVEAVSASERARRLWRLVVGAAVLGAAAAAFVMMTGS